MERTCVLIKPDGVARGLCGEIIARFERRGLRVVKAKTLMMSERLIREHYRHLEGEPFFPEILDYMASGPVLAIVLEAHNAVEACRKVIGATDPVAAAPGTIRGDLATSIRYNLVHASDSRESAEAEAARFFA
ncbi:MAG: nucleoside-diphosphate kinase [Clostridia bacterium]|nr:nucleoside-diphosphate kinase [Clostridia bacterium]